MGITPVVPFRYLVRRVRSLLARLVLRPRTRVRILLIPVVVVLVCDPVSSVCCVVASTDDMECCLFNSLFNIEVVEPSTLSPVSEVVCRVRPSVELSCARKACSSARHPDRSGIVPPLVVLVVIRR